jgi:hypothetical protein
VRGSNLGRDIGYRDWGFLLFFSQSLRLATTASFQMLSILRIVCRHTIRRCIISILKECRKVSHDG